MIPPVDIDLLDEEADDSDLLRSRPEWIKWKVLIWNDATRLLDDQQRGWYHTLLMYSVSQGEPPGYLPDDDTQLRQIAGIKDLSSFCQRMMNHKIIEPSKIGDFLAFMNEDIEKRWVKVLSKFKKSKANPGLIYNKTMVEVLKDAYRKSEFLSKAGKIARAKDKETKRLLSNDESFSEKMMNHSVTESSIILSQNALSNEIKSSEEKPSVVKSTTSGQKSGRKSLFDEGKFELSPSMSVWLENKYPEFDEGDVDYFVTKFKQVFVGKSYISWTKTFYTFVNNEVVLYKYRPGDYNWRSKQKAGGSSSVQKPWESAAERNTRLEREADEYQRDLLERGNQHHSQSPPPLSLATDDDE